MTEARKKLLAMLVCKALTTFNTQQPFVLSRLYALTV